MEREHFESRQAPQTTILINSDSVTYCTGWRMRGRDLKLNRININDLLEEV